MWKTLRRPSGFPTFQQPLLRRLALFSIIKWPCFRLSKCRVENQTGPLFDYQMALFSFDKNNLIVNDPQLIEGLRQAVVRRPHLKGGI